MSWVVCDTQPPIYACAVGSAAAFAVNLALVPSQWQHRAWTFSLHLPINAEHETEQTTSRLPFFKSSVWLNRESNPAYKRFVFFQVDRCISNEVHPCQNGGTCEPVGDDLRCICSAGYTGQRCETEIDECQSTPCMHSGQCTDAVNGYTCNCAQGGFHCFC